MSISNAHVRRAVVLIVGAARASPKEMHYGVLSYFAG